MPGIAYTLGLSAAPAIAGLNSVRSALGSLTGLVGRIAPILGLAGGLGLVAGAAVGLKNALDLGGELTDLSARTGEGIAKLTVFRQALDDTGVGAESAGHLINLMQKALSGVNEEGLPTVDAFKKMGLSLSALNELSPVEQLTTIGAALANLGNEGERTRAVMEVFGRSGGELKQFFADPEAMQIAARSLGSMPAILQKNAALFDNLSDIIGRLKTKGTGLFVGIASGFAAQLEPTLNRLDGFDAAAFGAKIGDAVNTGLNVIIGGKLGEVAGLSLKVGFGEAVKFLGEALQEVISGIGTGLKNVFLGVALTFTGAIQEQLDDFLGGLSLFGHSLFSQSDMAASKKATETQLNLGAKLMTENGFWNGFITGADDAKTRLVELWDSFKDNASDALVGGLGEPRFRGALAAASDSVNTQKIDPLTDRLAKIGGFIGGAGGPRGERAALDTAKWTQKTAEVVQNLYQFVQRTPASAEAVF